MLDCQTSSSAFDLRTTLGGGVAHLYEVVAQKEDAARLTEEELGCWLGLADPGKRAAWMARRAGVPRILERYLGGRSFAACQRKQRGKPFFEEGPFFSISHTLDHVFLAVADDEVGLDVEAATRTAPSDAVVRAYFQPAERDFLSGVDRSANASWRLRFWVAKEAMVKLAGDGIAYGLGKSFVLPEAGQVARGDYAGRDVTLTWPDLGPDWLVAIASWTRLDVKTFVQNQNAP